MDILAVDDEKDVLDAIASSLKLKGHEVLCAENGPAALAILDERAKSGQRVSIILSDLFMPQMSGEMLFTEVKKSLNFYNLPFAIMSGNATQDQIRGLIELGVDGVICKPFTGDVLMNALQATIKRREEKDTQELLKSFNI